MRNYQQLVVYAPMTDISDMSWEAEINRKTFHCGSLLALKELKEICPNIKTCTIEIFTEHLNRNEINVNNNWFGVIYIEM